MADKVIIEAEVKSNVGEVTKETKELSQESKKATTGVAGIGKAFKGIGTAIKAAGIGLAVALMAKLMEVFSKNQKVLDFFNIAMETLSIAFNDLFGFLSDNVGTVVGYFKSIFEDPKQSLIDFGNAIKENLIERFDSLLETFGHLGKAIGHLFKGEFAEAFDSVKDAGKESIDIWTGVDNTFDKVSETIKTYAIETIKSAKATIELNKASELAQVQVQGLIEEYDRQSEKLRQVRDDETKTFAERIEANKKLGEVLTEQGVEMQKLVDIQVHAAQVEFNKNKSQENLIALTEALNEKKAVEAQITGFQSEQLTNQVSLEKELGETQKEIRAEGLAGMELELQDLQDAYDLKIKMAEKAGMKTTAITKKFEAAKTKIVKDNENAKLAAISGFASAVNALAGEQKGIAVATALMNTYLGITEVMKDPTIPSTTMKFLAAGTVLASGLANVQNILKQDVGGGGGGGSAGAAPQTPAPQMMQGAFTLGGGVEPEPARAYVVSDDITNNQNKLAIIRRRATI